MNNANLFLYINIVLFIAIRTPRTRDECAFDFKLIFVNAMKRVFDNIYWQLTIFHKIVNILQSYISMSNFRMAHNSFLYNASSTQYLWSKLVAKFI